MDSKLTLKLDTSVIEKAKEYAKKNEISLSRLIENYLASLTQKVKTKKEIEITPLVKSLSGIVQLDENVDEKKIYGDYLLEKYK